MAQWLQWLRAFDAFREDQGLVPSMHLERITTMCNSSSTVSDILFWPLLIPAYTRRARARTHTHKINQSLKKNSHLKWQFLLFADFILKNPLITKMYL